MTHTRTHMCTRTTREGITGMDMDTDTGQCTLEHRPGHLEVRMSIWCMAHGA